MRRFTLSEVALGVFLIAIGVAYLWDLNANTSFLVTLYQFYPVLPILLGIDYLLYGAKRQTNRPEGWVTTLIILIVVTGLVTKIVPLVFKEYWAEFERDLSSYHGLTFEGLDPKKSTPKTLQQDFPITAEIKKIRVENSFGDIKITQGTEQTIHAKADLKIWLPQKYKKTALLEEFQITKQMEGDCLVIKLSTPEVDEKPYRFLKYQSKFSISLPAGIPLDLKNSFGKISSEKLNNQLKVENSQGKIQFDHLLDSAEINNQFGDLMIGTAEKDLLIDVSTGQSRIKLVKANLTVQNGFGDLRVNRVEGNLVIESKTGSVKLKEVLGNAKIDNSFGDLTLDDCQGAVTATVSTGNLKLSTSKLGGNYDLKVQFGNLELKLPSNAQYNLNAKSSFGNLELPKGVHKSTKGTQETVRTTVNGGGPLLTLKVDTGNVTIK